MSGVASAKIFHFMEERETIIQEVSERIVREKVAEARASSHHSLEYLLNEAHTSRCSAWRRGSSKLDLRPYGYWHQLARSIGRASEEGEGPDAPRALARLCPRRRRKFTPAVYQFSTKVLPVALSVLFNAQSMDTLFRNFRGISDRILSRGDGDRAPPRGAGTLIVVPTHSSNLDSIVVGWGARSRRASARHLRRGQEPLHQPHHQLLHAQPGRLQVDRRIKHTLYKDILKTTVRSCSSAATTRCSSRAARSRSNHVERHLKLGLLGSGLTAYTNNLLARRENPKIFRVSHDHQLPPGARGGNAHLRAPSLDGGARYIIEDDEFSDVRKVVSFAMKMASMESTMLVALRDAARSFRKPGERAGRERRSAWARHRQSKRISLGERGSRARPRRRDAEYTRECGRAVAEAFQANTVVVSTELLAWVIFSRVRQQYPGLDLYRLLRVAKGEVVLSIVALRALERAREGAHAPSPRGRVQLASDVARLGLASSRTRRSRSSDVSLHAGAVGRANGIEVTHPNLVHYYANRLEGYGLDAAVAEESGRAAAEAHPMRSVGIVGSDSLARALAGLLGSDPRS